MASIVTTLHLQASVDAALSCKPVWPVTRTRRWPWYRVNDGAVWEGDGSAMWKGLRTAISIVALPAPNDATLGDSP